MDVRDENPRRYRLINCQDVIEHCYDLENVLADLSAKLEDGGILLMAPTFTFEYNNDHLEKNTAYLDWFPELCETAELKLVARMNWNTQIYMRLARTKQVSVSEEKIMISQQLYQKSQKVTLNRALKAFNNVSSTKKLELADLNAVADNLAVYRLCCHRLQAQTQSSN